MAEKPANVFDQLGQQTLDFLRDVRVAAEKAEDSVSGVYVEGTLPDGHFNARLQDNGTYHIELHLKPTGVLRV